MSDLNVALVGEGAIADIHMQSLSKMPDVVVSQLISGNLDSGRAFAQKWSIPIVTTFEDMLAGPADAVILATPSHLHAAQVELVVAAKKHVMVEIPIGMSLAECMAIDALASATDKIIMPCHTRRFSPAHRRMRDEISDGRLSLQHLVAETYFLRRENRNMFGELRDWTDSLLWHHAAHSIDLFLWLTGQSEVKSTVLAGPPHPELGCVMDMTIGLCTNAGQLLSLTMSFNNDGHFGGFYRYICDKGTFHVFRDGLKDAQHSEIPLIGEAFADQNRAFVDAIRSRQAPPVTIKDVLPSMRIISDLSSRVGIGA